MIDPFDRLGVSLFRSISERAVRTIAVRFEQIDDLQIEYSIDYNQLVSMKSTENSKIDPLSRSPARPSGESERSRPPICVQTTLEPHWYFVAHSNFKFQTISFSPTKFEKRK